MSSESFTMIPNDILDELCQTNFSAHQTRVVLHLIRKTLGWQKDFDWISQSQFAKDIGLDRRHVHRALKQLEDARVVVVQRDDKKRIRYGIQKDFQRWKPELLKRSVTPLDDRKGISAEYKSKYKRTKLSSRGMTKKQVVTPLDDSLSSHGAYTKKSITKEKKYTPSVDEKSSNSPIIKTKKGKVLEGWQREAFMQFWKAFNYYHGRAAAGDVWIDLKITPDMLPEILKGAGHEAKARPKKEKKGLTPKMAQGWLADRRWEDEVELVNSQMGGSNGDYW